MVNERIESFPSRLQITGDGRRASPTHDTHLATSAIGGGAGLLLSGLLALVASRSRVAGHLPPR